MNKYLIVKKCYDDGNWTIKKVKDAVKKNWITIEEFEIITGTLYSV